MNFEALPSNCFNIGKKVKMKVTSAVPLCLLAGMAIVTCGCTAMKLRSEDPAVRMEAVKSYTTVEDWFDIAISDYPEDVRLYALERLKDNQEAIDKHHASPMMEEIIKLREKYELHMKVERYISDDLSITENDRNFIKD